MKNQITRKKLMKFTLILCLIIVFVVTLNPMFNTIKMLIGSAMTGWWIGIAMAKIYWKE